jgi:hypothetical protein
MEDLLPVSNEVRIYGDEKRNQELLGALNRIAILLEEIAEAPPAITERVDLGSLIDSLPVSSSFDYEALADAVSRRFPADRSLEMVGVLQKVTDELRGIGKKLKAASVPIVTGPARTTIKNSPENPIPVEIIGAASGLTDEELRASPVPVEVQGNITLGSAVEITNDVGNAIPVSGPATDAQLRATPLPVSGTVSVTEPVTVDGTVGLDAAALAALEAINVTVQEPLSIDDNGGSITVDGSVEVSNFPATQPVSGTFWQNTQPVSGTVTVQDGGNTITVDGTVALDAGSLSALETITVANATFPVTDNGGSLTVDGPVTDAQIRATPLPVSGTVTVTDGSGSLTVDGTVEIGTTSLAALETIELGATTLSALENTSVIADTELTTKDFDSGAGTDTTAVTGLVFPASGGSVAAPGDTTNGLDVDVTRLPPLVAGTAAIGKLAANDGVDIGDVSVNNAIALDSATLAALETITIGTALPAGTAAIGKLAANDGVDIGDVTINNASLTTTVTKTSLTGSAPTAVSVGITSVSAVASNANRKGLILTNTSANTISLAIATAAVLSSGITLNVNGGVWVMDEYSFTTAEIRAIASGAASNLAIQEFTT